MERAMRNRRLRLAAGIVALTVAVTPATIANADEGEPAPQETVSFTVVGTLPEGEFPIETLATAEVTPEQIAAIEDGMAPTPEVPVAAAAAAAATDPAYRIVTTWRDNKTAPIVLRWGTSSWGWLAS